jgi:hypothetical protein
MAGYLFNDRWSKPLSEDWNEIFRDESARIEKNKNEFMNALGKIRSC